LTKLVVLFLYSEQSAIVIDVCAIESSRKKSRTGCARRTSDALVCALYPILNGLKQKGTGIVSK